MKKNNENTNDENSYEDSSFVSGVAFGLTTDAISTFEQIFFPNEESDVEEILKCFTISIINYCITEMIRQGKSVEDTHKLVQHALRTLLTATA